MYYKKQGSEPPLIKAGCVYEESYFYDGYLFLKYLNKNIPSILLAEITQNEYEAHMPVVPAPEPTEPKPTDQDAINANLMATMNEILLKLNGGETIV